MRTVRRTRLGWLAAVLIAALAAVLAGPSGAGVAGQPQPRSPAEQRVAAIAQSTKQAANACDHLTRSLNTLDKDLANPQSGITVTGEAKEGVLKAREIIVKMKEQACTAEKPDQEAAQPPLGLDLIGQLLGVLCALPILGSLVGAVVGLLTGLPFLGDLLASLLPTCKRASGAPPGS
ncbi:hypothetical protein GCM10012275_51050 [Longimycelium tulufanense]|uniref:Secreted protein n=1 Tax=Longimycelium tulufanense TaxID=907463 RepID=A0A8J3CCJ0_9PSEU|nr:hypothetical protein [Longimycelium tulufanense]GGM74127.1 hypothetical protein GCM10012275_51050 [Longimycelium tulufanense]